MQVAVPRGRGGGREEGREGGGREEERRKEGGPRTTTRWESQNVRHGGSVNGMLYIHTYI
jgi:hypothetical protein